MKDQLRSETGVSFYLDESIEDARSRFTLSGWADGMLIEGIRCVVVGFDDDACKLLHKSKEWLEEAIATSEKSRNHFIHGTEGIRHENLALCNWLLSDQDDRQNLDAGVNFSALYNAENPPHKQAVAMELPIYVDARRYDEALAIYEQHWGAKKPSRLTSIKGEATMSYVIAATKARREYSDEQVKSATDSFLRHKVPDFLERGGYPYLARWLKIIHWNEKSRRAGSFQTVRKCYDYLPGVAPPTAR